MKQQKKSSMSKKRIADEILRQIGGSVILVFLLIAAVAICMVAWLSISARKTELIQESRATANQLTGFLEQYTKSVEQLAANPEIKQVMRETKAGGNISQAAQKEAVLNNLANIAASDSDNVMAVWISDLDASSFLQSDGLTNEEDWDITGRSWYSCIETKQTILTEPYVDSTNGKMVLSAAAPVYDDVTGDILGAVGMDITLDQMTKLMSEYKILSLIHI